MKKLLLILSLISLPLTSAVNSLNISVSGVDPIDDPKEKNSQESSSNSFITSLANKEIHENLFLSYFEMNYKTIYAVNYKKEEIYSESPKYTQEKIMFFGEIKYFRNTDSIVDQIRKIAQKGIEEQNNTYGLAICLGGNNEDYKNYKDEAIGITINNINYIKQLSKIQNNGSDKESICIVPKKIEHKLDQETGKKTVELVYDVIDLETGLAKEENKKDGKIYFYNIKQMNISTIFTTVAGLNMLNKSYKKMHEASLANKD